MLRGGPPAGGALPRPGGLPGGPPPGVRLGGGGLGGGPGGGNDAQVTTALRYVAAHGGGTLGVSSQQGASASILASGASVAGIGGFSGRESQVSVAWLAGVVGSGHIRWVLTDGNGGGMPNDGRVGARTALSAVAKACTATSVSGLYDCQGRAAALAALT